jgi:hypothetical protein
MHHWPHQLSAGCHLDHSKDQRLKPRDLTISGGNGCFRFSYGISLHQRRTR